MVTAARFGGSGLLFIPELRKRYLGVGFRLALLSFLGNAALSTSLKFTSAARAGFFCAMSVVMTPLLAALVRKEYPERKHIIASAIAAFGVFLMAKEVSAFPPLGITTQLSCENTGGGIVVFTSVTMSNPLALTPRL